jgi:ADP-ribosyl-[dinitrogen reductase] hydrolase
MAYNTQRIRAALYGALIGDALGVPYEFHAPAELPPKHQLEMTPPVGFRRAHQSVPIGTWSDDGALMLALMDSLATVRPLYLTDFAKRMLAWREQGKYTPDGEVFDVGNQTNIGLSRFAGGMAAAQSGPANVDDNGNGALMRVLPAAFLADSDEEAVSIARQQGLPTHGHLWSQLACALYVLVVRRALENVPVTEAIRQSHAWLQTNLTVSEAVVANKLQADRRPGLGRGFVLDSLWSVFDCVEATSTFEDAVKAAVALGHDTDTTACIVGGLAGAMYGWEGIPERWVTALHGKDLVETLFAKALVNQ